MSPRKLEALAMRLGRDVDDLTELWTERAAIREYEGGASRKDAEAGALLDVGGFFSSSSTRNAA